MTFTFVTYWWGRGNLNFNTQRPCPFDTKLMVNLTRCLQTKNNLTKKQILKNLLDDGTMSIQELENESVDFEQYLDILNKIGIKIQRNGKYYVLINITKDCQDMLLNKMMLLGKITYVKNPWRVLGKSLTKSYHQNASNDKLCKYKFCYQFPFKFEDMIDIWEKSLKNLNVNYYTKEYKVAPSDYPSRKSILGKYDFRTNQEAMNFKGEFIYQMISELQTAVVYIDGDMRIHKYPKIFDSNNFDFMLRHWQFDPLNFMNDNSFTPGYFETSGGIMYFNNTKNSIKLLKGWIRLNKEIMRKKEPGADDRILTMYIHKTNSLYSCRWLPLPSTYLWLTNKFSLDMFHGDVLPRKFNVVIDHPHCLTTEEMARSQGAIMNTSGTRYPKNYYKYLPNYNIVKFPFEENPKTLNNVLNKKYKERLLEMVKNKKYKSIDLNKINNDDVDVHVHISKNMTKFSNTIRGQQMLKDYQLTDSKNPTANDFMKWLEDKPYTLMTTRIHII